MTAFGKILVFLNLVFALLTGGLIGMVYLTRTNWKVAYDRVSAASLAETSKHQEEVEKERGQVRKKDEDLQKAILERNELQKKLTAEQAQLESTKALLAAKERSNDRDAQTTTATTAEIERRRNEVRQLNDILRDRENRIRDIEDKLTKTRDEAVNNQLLYKSLKEKYEGLLTQYEETSRKLAAIEARGITAPTTSVKAPPPEQVRGTVKAIDGNLATISIGTDAGVNKDNVLYIYRLSPAPEYLGELTILSATPFEAVGRIKTTKRQTVVKPGDEVASRIAIQK